MYPNAYPPPAEVIDPLAAEAYNFEHFGPRMLFDEASSLLEGQGPQPGDVAPDFTLQDTDGTSWRLSDLRGHPVVLVFGSGT